MVGISETYDTMGVSAQQVNESTFVLAFSRCDILFTAAVLGQPAVVSLELTLSLIHRLQVQVQVRLQPVLRLCRVLLTVQRLTFITVLR